MKTCHSNAELMFETIQDALTWRTEIDEKAKDYLLSIDKLIASWEPGEIKNLALFVKRSNQKIFLRCMSYILIGCNMINQFHFSEDFLKIKRAEQ